MDNSNETNTAGSMGKAQRRLEQCLSSNMHNAEIVSKTLKVAAQENLPINAFNILEEWALRTYKSYPWNP